MAWCCQPQAITYPVSPYGMTRPQWVKLGNSEVTDYVLSNGAMINTLKSRHNGHHFTEYIYNMIFFNKIKDVAFWLKFTEVCS